MVCVAADAAAAAAPWHSTYDNDCSSGFMEFDRRFKVGRITRRNLLVSLPPPTPLTVTVAANWDLEVDDDDVFVNQIFFCLLQLFSSSQ